MKNKFIYSLVLFIAFGTGRAHAQTGSKTVSLEDIWTAKKFNAKTVSGLRSMNDGLHYTILESNDGGNQISQYAYATGKLVKVLIRSQDLSLKDEKEIDDYSFSADESKILIATEKESIYRRSWKAKHLVVDLASKKSQELSKKGEEMYASFSPSGSKVAYVYQNNLYYKDLANNTEFMVTKDGEHKHIINGASDWVYEEELYLAQAFQWAPDGNKIAYYRFDETAVKEWNMKIYDGLYPTEERFKYPKAGEENSKVDILVYNLSKDQHTKMIIPEEYEYLPFIEWTTNPNQLAIMSCNRHQNDLHINILDVQSGEGRSVHHEKSDTYIEMPFEVDFLSDQQLIYQSEKSGFNHLYLLDIKSGESKAITSGNWPVMEYYGCNVDKELVYYQSAEESPLRKAVYQINLDGSGKKKLSSKPGKNDAKFSAGFNFYINYHSDANSPTYVTLHDAEGKEIRVLEDNQALKETLAEYQISPKTFFQFTTSQGQTLNAWMIKPANFNPRNKYPVFLTIYGGPGSQTVTDSWGSSNYFWHQHLASKGYIVVSVDNRGTGARGAAFKKSTYKQMGKLETEDQIEAAKYFASLAYVDKERIGVQGWSYGGYMSSLCLLKGADYFKAAIAVAPVTTWRYYDSIYTERYMQLPQENEEGYDDNSPINHVDKLKGKYLLIHGIADDNVHFQNTAMMIKALVEADKDFELAVYPDKNHGISGGNTRLHLYRKMTNFIENNL